MNLRDDTGAAVRLGKKIAEAGEGRIFAVAGDERVVAKLYKQPPGPAQIEKLRFQAAQKSPALRGIAAWPERLVMDSQTGRVAGFLMQRLDSRPIHQLYRPKDRRTHFPRATWMFLLHVARNLAAAFETLHENGVLMADVNEGNVFVSRDGFVGLIDCDSYQVTGPDGGVFGCAVGTPIWTAPELHGVNFAKTARRVEHDRFGLALLLFHLLVMGRHPYAGVPIDVAKADDRWTLEWAMGRHHFTYSRARPVQGFRPPPYTPPAEAMPPELFALFEAAFSPDPQSRPSAKAWHDVLTGIREMRRCPRNPAHDYGTHLSTCPWCHIHIKEGGPDYFVIPGLASTAPVGFAEVERAWNEWRSVRRLDFDAVNVEDFRLPPVTARPMPMASTRTESILRKWWYQRLRAMGLSIYGNLNPAFVRERDFRRRAWNVTRLHAESLVDSRNRVVAEYRKQFDRRVRALHPQLLAEWRRLQALRRRRIDERKSAFQFRAFMDGKRLDSAGDIGLDPHALMTVLEYGIETALDVREGGATSGLGPALTASLETWARKSESGFRFDPSQPLPEEEIARIDIDLNPQWAALRKRITDGLSTLAGIETETRMRVVHFEKQFASSIGALAQARADYAIAYSAGG